MKKILFLGLGAAALISLYSCASGGGAAPKTAPAEQSPVVSTTTVSFPVPAVDLSGVSAWYVRESGDDQHDGTSEGTAFKTLARAVYVATQTPVKTITVIGTLTTPVKIEQLSSDDEILISGKEGAGEADAAVLNPKDMERAILIDGAMKIRLERIAVTAGGIGAFNGVTLTLGSGAKITECQTGYIYGGGIQIAVTGSLTMEGDAEISRCGASMGGGIFLGERVTLLMKDNAVIKENVAVYDPEKKACGYGGGVNAIDNCTVTIQDNASIDHNNAQTAGGGVLLENSTTLTLQGNGTINHNNVIGIANGWQIEGTPAYGMGGGICAYQNSAVVLQDTTSVSENNAGTKGGGIYLAASTFTMKGNSVMERNGLGKDIGMLYGMSIGGQYARDTQGYGGGVILVSTASGIMEDNASIQGSIGADHGGGVAVNAGTTFTMKGSASIEGNNAFAYGGGVIVYKDGVFTMEGASAIRNNTVGYGNARGGGVVVAKGGVFNQNTGTVSSNTAPGGDNDIYREQ